MGQRKSLCPMSYHLQRASKSKAPTTYSLTFPMAISASQKIHVRIAVARMPMLAIMTRVLQLMMAVASCKTRVLVSLQEANPPRSQATKPALPSPNLQTLFPHFPQFQLNWNLIIWAKRIIGRLTWPWPLLLLPVSAYLSVATTVPQRAAQAWEIIKLFGPPRGRYPRMEPTRLQWICQQQT